MSNLVENFFGAINTISQANVDNAKRDETVRAEVAQIVNTEVGEYKVTYQGNTFTATAIDPTVTYQKGDQVYVLIPRGDYSANKVILGSAENKSDMSDGDLSDLTNFYIIKGPNWLDWYKGKNALEICAVEDKYKEDLTFSEVEIETGKDEDGDHKIDTIKVKKYAYWKDYGFEREAPAESATYVGHNTNVMTDEELAEADEQLQHYSNLFDSIMVSASFRTEFLATHKVGQYMLRVSCITDNPLYIQDPSHPDYKKNIGEEATKVYEELLAFNKEVDKNKYESDPEYKKTVDDRRAELNAKIENLRTEKKYKITNFDLGFKQFTGAPYAYIADTPQKGYYNTKGVIRGLYSISLMQDGMLIADIKPTYLDDGSIIFDTQNSILNKNNIFVSNIDIRFAQKVNLTDSLFYPWIETPYGDTLYAANAVEGRPQGRGSVTLIPHLQKGLIDLVEETPEAVQIMWFRQDADVTSATPIPEQDEDEHGNTWFDYGGPSWYPIDKLIAEGDLNYDIDAQGNLIILKEAVQFQWTYKCVMVYRDLGTEEQREITRAEVEQLITRLDSPYNLEIEQVTSKDGRDIQLRIIDKNKSVYDKDEATGENYRDWFGTWWLLLQDGSYTRISDPYHNGLFRVNDFLLNDIAIFYVQAYDPYMVDPNNTGKATHQKEEITVLRKDIITSDQEAGSLLCDWIGRDTFNYDALGVIKDWAAEKDNTLEPEISWAEGKASTYVITIVGPDGVTPLSNREYYAEQSDSESGKTGDCPSSMMTNMWVDFENTIHFQVRNQYDPDRKDNTFTVKVQTVGGEIYEFKKTVFFTKDGDMGTIGAEWSAQIKPCNWKHSPDAPEGAFIEALDYVAPLVVNYNDDGKGGKVWEQDKKFRTFLRPFVKKNGIPLEEMDPFEGYFYKVYWDVRMPSSFDNPLGRLASHLRLYHADGTQDGVADGAIFVRDGTFYENGGMTVGQGIQVDEGNAMSTDYQSKVNDAETEQSKNGLIGFTVYPRIQYKDIETDNPDKWAKENYGAIEVRFFDNAHDGTGATMDQMLYRFIVKAQVDIMKGQYDQAAKKIQVEGNVERIHSITSYFPVDVLLNMDNIDFSDPDDPEYYNFITRIATNWPQYVVYNASGYDPAVFPDPLYFKYGPKLEKEEKNWKVYNLTPLTQTLEYQANVNANKQGYYYRAKPHLNMAEGFWGALELKANESPFKQGRYIRNQVMYLNAYGNVDINGWDGQGIDMNERDGTIFAVTVGAGYKRPSTNAFTGVLMGADRSQPRSEIPGYGMAYDEEANKHMPYITGLFGYQDGVQSFALMENGTAFFGRADRGGRIVVDGANATIYGGANGVMSSPEIGDPMWNSMRLTLCDLQHTTSAEKGNVTGYWDNEGSYGEDKNNPDNTGENAQQPIATGVVNGNGVKDEKYYTQGFNGKYFGWNSGTKQIDPRKLPHWYKELWSHAYMKPDGMSPYWLAAGDTSPKSYQDLPPYEEEAFKRGDTNMRIDYFWGEGDEVNPGNYTQYLVTNKIPEVDESNNVQQLSGFGPSRASTTPAIEIGQHIHGLMPGILSWCAYEDVFKTLNIPGDRNFMVTYDGTLWAMNGIFMGVLIGSNIIGGRIQGAEIGIGHRPPKYKKTWVIKRNGKDGEIDEENKDCHYDQLLAPWDWKRDIDDNGTPGHCIDPETGEDKGQGLGFYVDQEGNVIANSIKIYGGSIDIGRFHIVGGDLDDDDYGHLIQIAESDFIGPTHFYGNIAVGPALNATKSENADGPCYPSSWAGKQNLGNIFQTKGKVALGIILPGGTDTRFHNYAIGTFHKNPSLLEGGDYNYYQTPEGDTGIGKMMSLEQIAFFGIDTASTDMPKAGGNKGNKFQGHFWPMHFHYGETDQGMTGQEKDSIAGYMTTMDIFRSKGIKFTASSDESPDQQLPSQNYFRVGPWGSEGMMHWIRKHWQPQDKCTAPKAEGVAEEDKYLGWFGIQNRSGDGSSGTTEQNAIGITSWFAAPIIVSSDGESAWNTRGHFHMFTKAYGGNASVQGETFNPGGGNLDGSTGQEFSGWGVVDAKGSLYTKTAMDGSLNTYYVRTGKGVIGLGVESETYFVKNLWTMPSQSDAKSGAGLLINPYQNGYGEKGVHLWTREGNVHITRMKNTGVCTALHNSEVYLTDTKTMVSAPTEVDIGANWTNGHTPVNYIKMTTKEISFEGNYATPENQKNIYARFA